MNHPNSIAPKRILVIGAGAAGMMAAYAVAGDRTQVTVVEKNAKTGVKILMSGGTRCNLTQDTDPAGITATFGHAKRFLQPSVGKFPPQRVVEMFHSLGVATKRENTGKIFPQSDRAADVRNALYNQMINAGCELLPRSPVRDLCLGSDGRFEVFLDDRTLSADVVIVTAGGKSWPGSGTTGDAYEWLRKLGHTIVRPRPALVPIVGGEDDLRALSGMTFDDASVSVRKRLPSGELQPGKKGLLTTRRSSVLLTHFGLSGPAVMDVSGTMTGFKSFDDCGLEIDWTPSVNEDQWLARLNGGGKANTLAGCLREGLPHRMVDLIVNRSGGNLGIAELSKQQRRECISQIKAMTIPAHTTRGFEKAEVTAGGVSLSEVDPRTMASRIVPGLFIAGEVLDVDGYIGGYNFQAAFSTGRAAGLSAAEYAATIQDRECQT
ncbi:MAG: aminoacetone oxidase family FAD-binding enzyme [Planctomycetota bacterium]